MYKTFKYFFAVCAFCNDGFWITAGDFAGKLVAAEKGCLQDTTQIYGDGLGPGM